MLCCQRLISATGTVARPPRRVTCRQRRQPLCCCAHRSAEAEETRAHASIQRRSLLVSIAGTTAWLRPLTDVAAWADDASSAAVARAAPASQPSSADIKTVLVVGATGATGSRVVRELQQRGLTVRAGTRNVAKAEEDGIRGAVKADVTDPSSLEEAMRGVDAVIITTGYKGSVLQPAGFKEIDQIGTISAIDAARKQGVKKLVLMTSILTNGRAAGQGLNPGFVFLNLFGGVLDAKLEAERHLRSSDSPMKWVIVRPGGLNNKAPAEVGNVVVRGEDMLFGLPSDPGTSISRDSVAEVIVEALLQPAANNRVFEIVASSETPAVSPKQWFLQ